MKRLFTLMLVIAMLCCAFGAVAESSSPYDRVTLTSGEVMPYESVTSLFSFEIPSDYIMMDSAVFQTIADAMISMDEEEFNSTFGFDLKSAQALLGNLDPEAFANYDFIYAPNFVGNINATATLGIGFTPEFIEIYCDMLSQQLTDQYVSMGVAEESCYPLGLVTYGNNTFIGYGVDLIGSITYQYITGNANGDMIVVTFTAMEETDIVPILESMMIY